MAAGLGNAVFIRRGGDVIGAALERFVRVAHGDRGPGLGKHGDVVGTVAKYHHILHRRVEALHHLADAFLLFQRFYENAGGAVPHPGRVGQRLDAGFLLLGTGDIQLIEGGNAAEIQRRVKHGVHIIIVYLQ